MRKQVLFIMIITILSKITGFGREVAFASNFGSSGLTDTYLAAMTVSGMAVSFFTSSINTSLIPILTNADQEGRRKEFFSNFLNIITVLATVIVIGIIVFARPISRLVVLGFDGAQFEDVVHYTRLLAIIALLQTLTYAFVAWLQQKNRFYLAASVAIPMNIFMITGYMVIAPTLDNIVTVAIIGYLLQVIWVIVPFLREDPYWKPSFDLKDPYIKNFWLMVTPIFLTLAAGQINLLVDRSLASGLMKGTITNMYYANKVMTLFHSVFVLSISTVLFTKQAHFSSLKDNRGIYDITKKNASLIMMLMLPVSIGVMFLAYEIIRVLFLRGQFTAAAAAATGSLLIFYAMSILARAMIEVYARMFFALKEPRKPMISTLSTIVANIVLNLIFIRFMGANGLALASSIAAFIGLLVLGYQVRTYFSEEKMSLWSPSMTKYIVASLVMLGILFLIKMLTPLEALPDLVYAIIMAVVGISSYFGLLMVLKTEEVWDALALLQNRLKRKS